MEADYLDRLVKICRSIDIDERKILEQPPLILVDICMDWMAGEIDDIAMTEVLKNLVIMNPNKYDKAHD